MNRDLFFASASGDINRVRSLLEQRENIDAVDEVPLLSCLLTFQNGRTILHHASLNGHKDLVRMLLQYGAKASIADKVTFISSF